MDLFTSNSSFWENMDLFTTGTLTLWCQEVCHNHSVRLYFFTAAQVIDCPRWPINAIQNGTGTKNDTKMQPERTVKGRHCCRPNINL